MEEKEEKQTSTISEFEKRVEIYMQCDKRTLAELLTMRDLGLYPHKNGDEGGNPVREPITWPPVFPNQPINQPIEPVNPLYPGSWPWRVGDVYYTTTVTAKNGEN